MGGIAARIFVIAFLALYLLLLAALLGSELWNRLAVLSLKLRPCSVAQRLRRLRILPGPRNPVVSSGRSSIPR